jgi:hypothetical protein
MTARGLLVGAIVAGSLVCASEASAQSPTPASDNWQVQFVPYLWGSGLDGQVGVGNRTADVDASFSNILNHLQFAAMGLADVSRGHFTLLTDALFINVRDQQATPGPLFSSVSPQQKMFIFTPAAGYRLLDSSDGSLDVLGGVRVWHLDSRLQFEPGLLPAVTVQASKTWPDAIFGVRGRRTLSEKLWVSAYGDAGAGGADFTYQLVGTAGVDLHRRYALVFGYRVLSVNYDKNNVLLDTRMKGPLFGFSIKL